MVFFLRPDAATAALVVFGLTLWAVRSLSMRRRWLRSQIESYERMSSEQFLGYALRLFQSGGYDVDGPAEGCVVLKRFGARLAIKCVHGRVRCGVRSVESLIEVRATNDCDEATLVGIGGFTRQARTIAATQGIELIDAQDLAKLARSSRSTASAPILVLIDNEPEAQVRKAA